MKWLFRGSALCCLVFLVSSVARAEPSGEIRFRATARAHVQRELDARRAPDLIVRGLDAILARGHNELRANGYDEDADQLETEWVETYRPQFIAPVSTFTDIGSHAPWSPWISEWYAEVEAKIGLTRCEVLHLRDIFTINYGWPVVRDPHLDTIWCAETLEANAGDSCRAEYRRHAAGTKYQRWPDPYANPVKTFGVIPVAAYWIAMAACEALLWGSDGSFLCGPASTAVEIAVARYVAPMASDAIWDRANP
jgi:hypothetical protein